ncbi:MAG: DUF4329 domain-containing protein [Bacteroidetes bacterium]|nr:DUF4329 domain-containing protein [Bacteroidota bacterium]
MKPLFLAVSLLIFFCLQTSNAQVGSPGNFEKYEFQPEAWKLPDMSAGSVNEHGDYTTSIGLAQISSPSGLAFNFNIYYSSDIHYDDVSGWLGLGWQANPGTISRSVRGDYTPFNESNINARSFSTKDKNPVDFPSNLKENHWDGYLDLFNVSLPDGTNLEMVVEESGITSASQTHQFKVLNEKGFSVEAKFGPVSDRTGTVSVAQNKYYADGISATDYTSFIITAPNGIRYLYCQPTLELNIGFGTSQSVYVSTWRIGAIIGPEYKGNIWSADNNPTANSIVFRYGHETMNTTQKVFPNRLLTGLSVLVGDKLNADYKYEAISHLKYLISVESKTQKLSLTYIDDITTEKNSQIPYKVTENQVESAGSWGLIPILGRKRIDKIETYQNLENPVSSKLVKTASLGYSIDFGRCFLVSLTQSELEGKQYFFDYDLSDASGEFDYTTIWNYYNNNDDYERFTKFRNSLYVYHPYVVPFDINGYYKTRSLSTVPESDLLNDYTVKSKPNIGQLTSISFPTGKIESIKYTKKQITSQKTYDFGWSGFTKYKVIPYSYSDLENKYNKQISKNALFHVAKYFEGDIDFFTKSCPEKITISDDTNVGETIKLYSYEKPVFPGIVREMHFNDFTRLMDEGPDNTCLSEATYGLWASDWQNGNASFQNFVNNLEPLDDFITSKATRLMDVEDRVWFSEVYETVNEKVVNGHFTHFKSKQPIGILLFKSVSGSQQSVVLMSSNYHLATLQKASEQYSIQDGIRNSKKVWEEDDFSTKIKLNPNGPNFSTYPMEDFESHYNFKKLPEIEIADGLKLEKTFRSFDYAGNLVFQADYTGKVNNSYQFSILYNRYLYEESSIPGYQILKRNAKIQQISGVWTVDSLKFIDQDSVKKYLLPVENFLKEACGPNSAGDNVIETNSTGFKLISNSIFHYKDFGSNNGGFQVDWIAKSKDWKWYRYPNWAQTTLPPVDKWKVEYQITGYYQFGVPKSIDYGRFSESYYLGSKTNPFISDDDSIYTYKMTGRKITGKSLSLSEYAFSARYDDYGRLIEAKAPNKNIYAFGYDAYHRLVHVKRNGQNIRRYAYNIARFNGDPIKISTTDYTSNVDSLISTEFMDGLGLIQSQSGNAQVVMISEPVFDKSWEALGQTQSLVFKSGETGFQNPWSKTFHSSFTNGGKLQVDKLFNYGENKSNYDQTYAASRGTGKLLTSGGPAAFSESNSSPFGTNIVETGPGTTRRMKEKYSRSVSRRVMDNYLIALMIDEDERVQFAISETDGKKLITGSTNLSSLSPSASGGIVSLFNKINKTVSPVQSSTPVENPGDGGPDEGDGYDHPIDPPACLVASELGVNGDLIETREVGCGSSNNFVIGGTVTHLEQLTPVGTVSYQKLSPLSYLEVQINNLDSGKNLNLLCNGELIKVFTGPLTDYVFRYYGGELTDNFIIDYETDLGCITCSDIVSFKEVSLMNLIPQSVTQYKYNDLNQLVNVIHPDGSETRYDYDFFGNVIRKETPFQNGKLKNGTLPESDVSVNPDFEYAYDQYGQLRMSIDPNQSVAGKMSVFQYDGFGRLIETGEMNSSARFISVNAENPLFPFTTAPLNGTAALDPFDRGNFTAPADYIWKQQFYYDGSDTSEGRIFQVRENVPKPDGTLGTFTKEIKYRKEGWVAKVNTTYPNGVTQEEVVYTFDLTGKPTFSALLVNGTLKQRQWYEYSAFGQLTKVWLSKTTAKPASPTFTYNYNRFGQIGSKSIGPISTKLYQGFTEEGWLDSLSVYPSLAASQNPATRLFRLKYNYYNSTFSADRTYSPLYSGNIGQMLTSHKDITDDLLETFTYDGLNRLSASQTDKIFKTTGSIYKNDIYGSFYSYDVMGNVLNLQRNWDSPSQPGSTELKDNFIYQYDGSRLRNLVDLSTVATNQSLNIKTQVSTVSGSSLYQNVVFPGLSDGFEAYPTGPGLPSPDFSSSTSTQVGISTDAVKGKVLTLNLLPGKTSANTQADTIQVVFPRTYQLKFDYKTGFYNDGEMQWNSALTVSLIWLKTNKTVLSTATLLNAVNSPAWLTITRSVTAPDQAAFLVVKFTASATYTPLSVQIDNFLIEENNLAYTYDGNGNITQDKIRGISGIVYNSLNLPTQLSNLTQTVNYGYLWEGSRWFKKVGTTIQYYLRGSGGELLGEYTGTPSTMNYLNLYGMDLEGKWQYDTPGEYFYVKDHLGNVRQILKNISGAPQLSSKTDYYPFGAVMRETNSLSLAESKFKYQNKERDVESGYDYFEARMYDSQLGRFLQVDPHEFRYPNISSYAGMNNNPIRYDDQTGRDPGDLFKTRNRAARDFGKTFNGVSIKQKKEYGATIYTTTAADGKTYYSYSKPDVGGNAGTSVSPAPVGTTPVADIHSHGGYEKGYDNNNISPQDKADNDKTKLVGYVSTPDGSLKKYDPNTKKETVVTEQLPSDPNDPNRKNKINPDQKVTPEEKEVPEKKPEPEKKEESEKKNGN